MKPRPLAITADSFSPARGFLRAFSLRAFSARLHTARLRLARPARFHTGHPLSLGAQRPTAPVRKPVMAIPLTGGRLTINLTCT